MDVAAFSFAVSTMVIVLRSRPLKKMMAHEFGPLFSQKENKRFSQQTKMNWAKKCHSFFLTGMVFTV
jgi:hypothetical protein